MKTHRALALAFAGFMVTGAFAGCAAPVAPEGVDEDTANTENALQIFPAPRFYTIRKNTDCKVRLCTGYFVEEVNALRTERHVDLLKFVGEDVEELALAVEGAVPSGGLVLRGIVGPPIGVWEKRTLIVYDAYRGMPGADANHIDGFYRLVHEEHPVAFTAYALNSTAYDPLVRVDITRVIKPHVDQEWLRDRVLHHGALVAGHLHGRIGTLDVSQVFLKLPDERAACAPVREECSGAMLPTYTRDVERCLVFDACRPANTCSLPLAGTMAPGEVLGQCDEGYTRVGWRADLNSCMDYACEPEFIAH